MSFLKYCKLISFSIFEMLDHISQKWQKTFVFTCVQKINFIPNFFAE